MGILIEGTYKLKPFLNELKNNLNSLKGIGFNPKLFVMRSLHKKNFEYIENEEMKHEEFMFQASDRQWPKNQYPQQTDPLLENVNLDFVGYQDTTPTQMGLKKVLDYIESYKRNTKDNDTKPFLIILVARKDMYQNEKWVRDTYKQQEIPEEITEEAVSYTTNFKLHLNALKNANIIVETILLDLDNYKYLFIDKYEQISKTTGGKVHKATLKTFFKTILDILQKYKI